MHPPDESRAVLIGALLSFLLLLLFAVSLSAVLLVSTLLRLVHAPPATRPPSAYVANPLSTPTSILSKQSISPVLASTAIVGSAELFSSPMPAEGNSIALTVEPVNNDRSPLAPYVTQQV